MIFRKKPADPVTGEADVLASLFEGLTSRAMPETVAEVLLHYPAVSGDRAILKALKRRSGKGRTSMPEIWFTPVDLRRKIAVAQALWADQIAASNDPHAVISPVEADPDTIAGFIAWLAETIGKNPGYTSFQYGRLPRAERISLTGLGNHAYNKRFRLLNRMTAHLESYRRERRYVDWRIKGKVGMVTDLTYSEFASDPASAAFVAYFAARKRKRSVFTFGKQEPAFDDLAKALLQRALNGTPNAALIARVMPREDVVAHMTSEEQGQLIGQWLLELRDLSEELKRLWQEGDIDLATMIVRRGNDSSRWNLAAQCWNTARTAWLSLQTSIGGEAMLDHFMPGKVMRLMAGDVAGGHQAMGDGLHPDTKVWTDLPFPWDVMQGQAACGRAAVERVCKQHKVEPIKSGWTQARLPHRAAQWRATPELVHGVQVASPELASLLRCAGAFSGKG